MGTIAVTGSASGIGAAVCERLAGAGNRVIGVDLRHADVIADLATAAGRAAAVAGVEQASGGRLDGLVACAGVGPQVADQTLLPSVNYFGTLAILTGLRPALTRGEQPAAVALSSNSSTLPHAESPLVAACLAGDEDEARRLAPAMAGIGVYEGTKLALTRWVRRQASGPEWAGVGIRLNAVAPGATYTPLLQAGLDHPIFGEAIRNFPIPLGAFGTPEQIAAAVAFLLGPDAAFCCGSVLFVDGGTDALVRPESY